MAKIRVELEDNNIEDTFDHSKIDICGEYGDKKDLLYVEGKGFFLNSDGMEKFKANARRAEDLYKSKCDNLNVEPKRVNYSVLLDEDTISNLYNVMINSKRIRGKSIDSDADHKKKYEGKCYEGTDTCNKSVFGEKSNCFELDRSKSSIRLSITNGERFLNASIIKQTKFVHISIDSPDGRDICDVAMSFDQFTNFLVTNCSTPCTVDSYWSKNDQCVRLSEVVKVPDDITTRMAQRLNDRFDDTVEGFKKVSSELKAYIDSGKSMSKTKLENLHNSLSIFMGNFELNREFTVEQAKEEVASIIEKAACTIALEHKLDSRDLENNPQFKLLALPNKAEVSE